MSTPQKYVDKAKELNRCDHPAACDCVENIAAALHEAAKDAVRGILPVTASRSGAFWYIELHDDLDYELQRWDHVSTEAEAVAAREALVEELTR